MLTAREATRLSVAFEQGARIVRERFLLALPCDDEEIAHARTWVRVMAEVPDLTPYQLAFVYGQASVLGE